MQLPASGTVTSGAIDSSLSGESENVSLFSGLERRGARCKVRDPRGIFRYPTPGNDIKGRGRQCDGRRAGDSRRCK